MNPIGTIRWLCHDIGSRVVGFCVNASFVAGIVVSVIYYSLQPRTWTRPVLDECVRQIYYSGIKAVSLTLLIAVLLGPGLVSQVLSWSNLLGETRPLVQFIGLLVLRDVGPLLVNLIIIGRSGMAITAEIGALNAMGMTGVLDATGVDPFRYLLLTRVIGCAVAAFCLTQLFGLTVLMSGYIFAAALGVARLSLAAYLEGMLAGTTLGDLVLIALKTVLPAVVTASICCWRGLLVIRSTTEVARELPTAFVLCTSALFVLSTVLSIAI